MTDGAQSGVAPGQHEVMHFVPCEKAHAESCRFEDAIDFAESGSQPGAIIVVGHGAAVTRAVIDKIGRIGEHEIHAAFFGVDSSRAERDFYDEVYSSAVEAGAKEVVVVDTLGIASPEAVAELVGHTVELVDVPVHFHGHNDFGVATASAVAAVRAGAAYVHGTINGMGERAGNANLGEVALTLKALYGVESNLRLDRIREVSARVRELSGYELEPWKPVTGETLYRRESGAVASQFHDPQSIEPYSSELVATERSIVLGKKSGLDSVRTKADELGLELPEERRAEVLAEVKRLGATERRLVTDDEFRAIVG